MILVPTRELALQVSSVIKDLGKHLKIECMVSTGGTSFQEDIYRLSNAVHILVGNNFYKLKLSIFFCNYNLFENNFFFFIIINIFDFFFFLILINLNNDINI